MNVMPCPTCKGARLRPEALHVHIGDVTICDVTAMAIRDCLGFFENLQLTDKEREIARRILKEIRERLSFLVNVGLDYLSLDRTSGTLSGGEGQRIRLATQIGSSLVGVLYILDEPSIGLHQRDNSRLLTVGSTQCLTPAQWLTSSPIFMERTSFQTTFLHFHGEGQAD
jgi:excinuclease ABC subunit A